MKTRALRMLAEAMPDHANKTEASRQVGVLLGIRPETVRTWARQEAIDAGEFPEVTSVAEREIRRLKRENAQLRKANEIPKAASVSFAKELDQPTSR